MDGRTPQYNLGLSLFTPDNNQQNFFPTYIRHNEEKIRVGLETKEEVRGMARIKEEATKLQASRRFNTKVQPQAFQPSNLM